MFEEKFKFNIDDLAIYVKKEYYFLLVQITKRSHSLIPSFLKKGSLKNKSYYNVRVCKDNLGNNHNLLSSTDYVDFIDIPAEKLVSREEFDSLYKK